ncbi:MAG TPA: adenosylmethionine--8-amino-7-oxononanoate transaminase [Terriglobales bacterium]|nr:adenosylmethionine--8-amino-7-oxononanoate transaminase [Terriglobales bacterium]
MSSPADLAAKDHRYLWHPFTQMQDWLADDPVVIVAGEGNYLIDAHGKRYLDGVSSLWCNVHGHRHPALDAAARAQLDRIAHSTLLGLASEPSILLAERLVELTPAALTRVFYSDAGATAVEIALKMAWQYWYLRGDRRRSSFASLVEGYHGDTLGAVSVGYSELFHQPFQPLLFPCHKLTPPHVYRWHQKMTPAAALDSAIADAEQLFARHGSEIAALIVEPIVQGAAGMWIQPPGYLTALREITRRHQVLLICDEVATGFGRTGTMFAIEHESVVPDLLCLGKGITGGYLPLAATLATEEIFHAFLGSYEQFKSFFHGHTYTGNALACAVANANLELFAGDGVVARAERAGEWLGKHLHQQIEPLENVGEVRRRGLMAGIELVAQREPRLPLETARRVPQRIVAAARRRGVIIRPLGPVLVLMPPLSIREEELELLCDATREAIVEVLRADDA